VENGLGLTSKTGLLHVITSSTLAHWTFFTLLVLSNFVSGMLLALLAMGLSSFQNANHQIF
jgi:hypothetical protein